MNRIKAERVMRNLTQEQFAKEMNVVSKTAQRWEYGQINIPSRKLCEIADFFGCTTDWLLGRSERRKEN
jgi:transcriptional regulator with XRE-family HTH domain